MTTRQTNNIDTRGFLWVEQGEPQVGLVADVAPLLPIHQTYSFAVPHEMEQAVHLGQRVRIPVGKTKRTVGGYVVALDRKEWDSTLRPLPKPSESASYLSTSLVELGRAISAHYACPLGPTLKAMVPQSVHRAAGLAKVRYVRVRQSEIEGEQPDRLGPKQRAVLEFLNDSAGWQRLCDVREATGASLSTVRALEKSGLIEAETRRVLKGENQERTAIVDPTYSLNSAQRAALQRILELVDAHRFAVALLYGVSGSGKTEVYIHAMRSVLKRGQQAMLLVPEIVLTTQLVGRLAQRFAHVAVLHSGLTDAQRSVIWRQVQSGDKTVVIGTRSAVFAPCPNLGLIVVDEEQETSYKNLQAPRFHVRDVAIMRAGQLGIPVVLGSATPSIEAWHRSGTRNDYVCLSLPGRVTTQPLPAVHIIDMRDEIAERKQFVMLSRTMERMLAETLDRGEQAILLMNRRGFARRVFCPECKSSIQCPRCNVNMVMHTSTGATICHYCRTRIATPATCPNVSCGAALVAHGAGTQRIEQILRERYPTARIQRVDSDTMTHRAQYQKVVDRFEGRQVDILVGTQMIAKGLDFPHVSFVGVIDADAAMPVGDFRAGEHLFQLITQVAGRAGRAHTTGRVVVQTSTPVIPALRYAAKHDYAGFAEAELTLRRKMGLPPFRRLARIVLAHAREERSKREAIELAPRINDAMAALKLEGADVIGPTPCALKRMRGRYRYDLLVRTATAADLRALLKEVIATGGLRTKAESIIVDVDPVHFS